MPKETFFNLPEEKRQMIVDIAIKEFAENDYQAVSISRIVARARIAKGSFYQYFVDKQDLFMHLLDVAAQEKMAFFQEKTPPDPNMGLFPYLRWLVEAGTKFEFSRPKLNQVAYKAIYGDLPFTNSTLKRLKESTYDYYRQLIEMGMANGNVNPDIDPQTGAFILASVIGEFGNYLTKDLGLIDPSHLIKPDELSAAEQDALAAAFDKVFAILEQGLGAKNTHSIETQFEQDQPSGVQS